MLLAQIDQQTVKDIASGGAGYVMAAAVLVLAGVVVWLAKAYRDDMKENSTRLGSMLERTATTIAQVSEKLEHFSERMDGLCTYSVSSGKYQVQRQHE